MSFNLLKLLIQKRLRYIVRKKPPKSPQGGLEEFCRVEGEVEIEAEIVREREFRR
jgi:dsRNA-specific ribonuclease